MSELIPELQTSGEGGGVATVEVATAFPDDIRQIGDQMAALTSVQARDLRYYLEDNYGFQLPQTNVEPEKEEEKIEEPVQSVFDLILVGFDPAKKMAVIKEFRSLLGLGLAESKAAVEGSISTPFMMKKGFPKEEVEVIKQKLEAVGAKVEMK